MTKREKILKEFEKQWNLNYPDILQDKEIGYIKQFLSKALDTIKKDTLEEVEKKIKKSWNKKEIWENANRGDCRNCYILSHDDAYKKIIKLLKNQ